LVWQSANVLFSGPRPLFVDVLSFERRHPCDPIWLAYAQFVRMFLLPLLVNDRFRLPLDAVLTTRADGLEPDEVYQLCGPLQKFRAPMLTHVTLPTWLGRRAGVSDAPHRSRRVASADEACFILGRTVRGLRRAVNAVAPSRSATSRWSPYSSAQDETEPYQVEKLAFVSQALQDAPPKRLLDLGCNAGRFSVAAAERGAEVVAVDRDPVVVGRLWRRAMKEGLDILPLVVNVAAPTAGHGWLNAERRSFVDRAANRFDTVMMLALVHHLVVSDRIPLANLFYLAARLTKDRLIIEFVAPEDEMCAALLRRRQPLPEALTMEAFEQSASRHFMISTRRILKGGPRAIYSMRRRPDGR